MILIFFAFASSVTPLHGPAIPAQSWEDKRVGARLLYLAHDGDRQARNPDYSHSTRRGNKFLELFGQFILYLEA
jgi:hypothetical protein